MTDQVMIAGKIQGFFIWKIMLKMENTNFWQIHPGTNEFNSSKINEYVAMLQQHLSKKTTSSSSLNARWSLIRGKIWMICKDGIRKMRQLVF